MKGHEEIRTTLPAFALDAVEAEDRAVIDAHLADCAICRDELEALRADVAAIDRSVVAPEGLWARISDKVRRRPTN